MNIESIIKELQNQVVPLLTELLKYPTESPPSVTEELVEFIQGYMAEHGIELVKQNTQVEGMTNCMASLFDINSNKSIIAMHSHLDVVPAYDLTQWKYPPYSAVVKDGCVWGRGAIDMKGFMAIQILTMIALKRLGENFHNNLLLIATADEERGGVTATKHFIENNKSMIDKIDFIVSEGGCLINMDDKVSAVVAVAEKLCYPIILRYISNSSGHAALQDDKTNNIIFIMDKVLKLINTYNESQVITNITNIKTNIIESIKDFPYLYNGLKNTITPTKVNSGIKGNIVPNVLEVRLDCRIHMNQNEAELLKSLRELFTIEGYELEIITRYANCNRKESEITKGYDKLENIINRALDIHMIPACMPFASDLKHFKNIGVNSYGFTPLLYEKDLPIRYHNFNERIEIHKLKDGLEYFIKFMYTACKG